MKKNIEAEIAAVTVYTDRALVTRKNTISLTGEEKQLILSGLPVTLLQDSVRVAGQGTSTVSILGVKVESVFTPEVPLESINQIDRQIQTLQNQQTSLNNQLSSRQLQLDFIQELSEKSQIQYAINLSKQQTNLEQTQALLDFIGNKCIDYSDHINELEQQQEDINNQISALEQQKHNLLVPQNKQYFNLIIFIETSEPTEFKLEVSYLVNQVSWNPLYDLKLDTQEKQLDLVYIAEVKQSTGENWQNVALTFSTAKPGLGTVPPKLQPWYIDVYNSVIKKSPVLPSFPMMMKSRNMIMGYDSDDSYDDELEENSPENYTEAIIVAATVAQSGSVVTFDVSGDGNIPSDGAPYKITLFRDRYPAKLEYVAIPRLVSFSYLQAVVTNLPTGVTLLPGKANILRDRTFVGTTTLENVAPSQEFILNLGIDDRWKIERDLVQRQADKNLIGNKKRITFAYRLIITNLQAQDSTIKLTEQLPVSRNENIKVRLVQAEPKIKLGEMGVLEWSLNIPEGNRQEIYYQFTLEYPPEVSLSGLDI